MRDLETAIKMWRLGRRISLTLATKLLHAGFDVEALEARYLKDNH
jgi:hypothetical protein